MSNQYEKLVEQQARLKQKIEREDFKLRQSKYYENRQAHKARSCRLIQSIKVEIAKRKAYTKSKFRRISRPSETRSMRTYTSSLMMLC